MKPKLILQLFVLGLCWALIYSLAFIQYLLYDPLKEALGCSNAQLGFLMTIFGLGNIFGAPLGGYLADRFDCKKILLASVIGNGILGLIFSMNMTYSFAVIVWIGLSVTTLVMNYPSHIKIIRMLATDENQGKIFGFNEAFIGVGAIGVNALFLYIFARFTDSKAGLQAVVGAIGALSLVMSVGAWFVLRGIHEEDAQGVSADPAEKEKVTGKDFVKVLLTPGTWMVGLAIFAVYSMAVTMSYFTPYATAVLGGTVAFSGVVSLIRTYAIRLLGAPFGGYLADKIGSVSKVLIGVYVMGIATLALFLLLPVGTPMVVFVLLMLLVATLVYMGKGIYYAVAGELYIPRKYTATTVGIAAALGFSPDIFLFALAGHWMDTLGNQGFRNIFMFQIAVLVVGILGALFTLNYKKKLEARQKAV